MFVCVRVHVCMCHSQWLVSLSRSRSLYPPSPSSHTRTHPHTHIHVISRHTHPSQNQHLDSKVFPLVCTICLRGKHNFAKSTTTNDLGVCALLSVSVRHSVSRSVCVCASSQTPNHLVSICTCRWFYLPASVRSPPLGSVSKGEEN